MQTKMIVSQLENSMGTNKAIIAGLQTLMPYYDNEDGFNCGAGHDEFYAYATDKTLSNADVLKMIELNWYQVEGCNDKDLLENYDPDESWQRNL